MNLLFKKFTVFYVLGAMVVCLSLLAFIVLAFDDDPYGDTWIFVMMILLPVLVAVAIDRFCVSKYGAKQVNKIQLFIIAGLFALSILIKVMIILKSI